MGYNHFGVLGLDLDENQLSYVETPRLVIGLSQVESLRSGSHHTVALTVSRRVFVWGDNTYGAIGTRCDQAICKPIELALPAPVKQVACGS